MDPLDDFLNHARRETVPLARVGKLEERVIARLASERVARARQGMLIALSGGLVAVSAALFLLRAPAPRPVPPPDFVESVVIVDGHTCIWLEPVPVRESAAHE